MAVLDERQEATSTAVASSGTQNTPPSATLSSTIDAGARVYHCSVIQDSILYVFGGQISPSATSNQASSLPIFASLNLTAASLNDNPDEPAGWQELPSTNTIPVLNPQCVLTPTHLLIVGGTPLSESYINPFAENETVTYCGLQAYSFAEQGWQSLMPESDEEETIFINLNRTGHVAEWIDNVGNGNSGLFVMGGIHYNATVPANDAYMMSPFTIPAVGGQAIIGSASVPNILPPPTINSGGALVDGGTSILFFGGLESQIGQAPTSIWEFAVSTSSWRTLAPTLPQGMPNVKTGWVTPETNLVAIDLSTANTGAEVVAVVNLATAGLVKRQGSSSTSPAKMDGYAIAFDPITNMAVVSGGNGESPSDLQVLNMTSNTWSVLSLQQQNFQSPTTSGISTVSPTATATGTFASAPTLTGTATTTPITATSSSSSSNSVSFTQANLLAPIILGGVIGILGILGVTLLIISRCRRRARSKNSKPNLRKPPSNNGLWLKYANQKEGRATPTLGGEIFLRNLEKKHGLRANTPQPQPIEQRDNREKTGWSKYFTTSWYGKNNTADPRASASTAETARALVQETRQHNGPYGAGWDAESHYSKASSFVSVASHQSDRRRESTFSGRWSGIRWSYGKRLEEYANGGNIGAGGVSRV